MASRARYLEVAVGLVVLVGETRSVRPFGGDVSVEYLSILVAAHCRTVPVEDGGMIARSGRASGELHASPQVGPAPRR